MLVRRGGVLVRVTAMLVRRRRVLFRFSMPPMVVMVRGFAVMMRSAFVMRRRFVMMFAGGMFCFGHDVSSYAFICPLWGIMHLGMPSVGFNLYERATSESNPERGSLARSIHASPLKSPTWPDDERLREYLVKIERYEIRLS
jgi:hypothetical protein